MCHGIALQPTTWFRPLASEICLSKTRAAAFPGAAAPKTADALSDRVCQGRGPELWAEHQASQPL